MKHIRVRTAASLLALALTVPGLVACGGDDDGGGSSTRATLQEGLAAQVAGRTDDARKAYESVLESDANNKFALYNLGLLAQGEGDLGEAEKRYRAALAQDKAYTPALYNLAIILTNRGTKAGKDEAFALYRQVIAATPKDPNAHLNIAFLFDERGDEVAAQREFRIAVRLDPSLAARIPSDVSPVGKAPAGGASPSS